MGFRVRTRTDDPKDALWFGALYLGTWLFIDKPVCVLDTTKMMSSSVHNRKVHIKHMSRKQSRPGLRWETLCQT